MNSSRLSTSLNITHGRSAHVRSKAVSLGEGLGLSDDAHEPFVRLSVRTRSGSMGWHVRVVDGRTPHAWPLRRNTQSRIINDHVFEYWCAGSIRLP